MSASELLLSIITAMLTLAIPWAAAVHGRIARIETTISNGMKDRLHEIIVVVEKTNDRLSRLETQVAVHLRAIDAAAATALASVTSAAAISSASKQQEIGGIGDAA